MEKKIQFITSQIFLLSFILTGVVCGFGYITPRRSILKHVGDTIEMTCNINLNETNGRNSSYLSFFAKSQNGSRSSIPRENIKILDETSILLTIENAKPMSKHYYCMLDEIHGVDLRQVSVGTAPGEVKEFKCRSYNFDNFICKFKMPDNYVTPLYNLKYQIKEKSYDCPLVGDGLGNFTCNISMESGLYRQVHEFYDFTLKSENALGTRTQLFHINHFDSVIPAKPSIKVLNETSNSAILEWSIEKYRQYWRKDFLYDAKIMSEHSQRNWTTLDLNKMNITKTHNIYKVQLADLEYAYTWYDIRMRIKLATAEDAEDMWSQTANYTFRTLARIPDEPPQTDIGSFHIDLNGNIHLFWKALPKYKENGQNAHYVISEIKQNGRRQDDVKPQYIDMTTAKFNLLPADYEFVVKSANSLGLSDRGSVIKVPRNRIPDPLRLKKIYNENKYSLFWTAPINSFGIVDYTVFWCISKSESSNQCEGSINFTHVDKNIRNITHETKDIVNFAISANSINSSSGMVWAMCTALKDSDFGKMRPLLTVISATTIKMEWSLECVYSSILQGYHLVYCPISDPVRLVCTEPEKNVTIPGDVKGYFLENLTPYTTYKIVMSMFSETKQGPPSEPLLQSTMETAPSHPRNLNVVNGSITNNSVILTWESPLYLNGRLRYYKIVYNNEDVKVEGDMLVNETKIYYKLDRLRSFYFYKIYVVATTIEDSLPSNDISVQTAVGTPGSIEQPKITKEGAKVNVSWNPPVVPSGRIEFYELRLTIVTTNNVIVTNCIYKINGTSCRLRVPNSQNIDIDRYEFCVRAVNLYYDDDNHHHASNKRDTSEMAQYIEVENFSRSGDEIETTILKRHSNAELNFSYENSQQTLHKINRIRHNRQERENLKDIQNSSHNRAPTTDTELSYECEEQNDKNLNSFLDSVSHKSKRLRGEWSNVVTQYVTYEEINYQNIILAAGCVIILIFVVVVLFFGCKKYRKMKDIVVVFPAGLNDLVQETRSKGVDNTISKDDITRSDESLFKNEERHLLSGRIEVGYTHAVDCSEKIDGLEDDTNSERIREEDNSGQTDSVELSDLSDSSRTSPIESPSINLREKSGHIKPLNNPIIINGYVQHQSFQKPTLPTSFTGYTQLDAFGKPILPNHISSENGKHKSVNMMNGPDESICGYVTHKQLSEFGHRLQ